MKKQQVEEWEGGVYEILKNLCCECYSRTNGEFWKSYEALSKDSLGKILTLIKVAGAMK